MASKKLMHCAVVILGVALSSVATARDDKDMYSIEDALNAPAAQEKLDSSIKLFFGNQKHPGVAQTFGEWKTNKKTNGFNKSDEEGCAWVFLSAVLELQERAKKEGGDAVINIASNYKNIETISDTEYMCGNGTFVTGVALKGTVVKLGKAKEADNKADKKAPAKKSK